MNSSQEHEFERNISYQKKWERKYRREKVTWMTDWQKFCVDQRINLVLGGKGLGWISTNKVLFIKQTKGKSYLPLMLTNPAEIACQYVFHMNFQQMHTFKDTWRRTTQGLMKTWSWSTLRKQLISELINSSEYNCFCFLFLWCLCPMTCLCPSLQEMWRFFPSIRFMCFFPISPYRLLFWTVCLDVCLLFLQF